jgi:SAM-dependent methyltransferase
MPHPNSPISDWVARWTHLLPHGGTALDLACGKGRHSHWLAQRGLCVTAVDLDPTALAEAAAREPAIRTVQADLENQPWPLKGQTFDAVVVTNYLWRPLWPDILASLSPGGVLLYETFAHGNATVGRPSRPDFLLQPGELLHLCSALRVVAFENGFLPHPERFVQRVCAVAENPTLESSTPKRYFLGSAG